MKYCYECKGSKTSSKIHHWVRDGSGCKCKLCGITANEEDAKEIMSGDSMDGVMLANGFLKRRAKTVGKSQ